MRSIWLMVLLILAAGCSKRPSADKSIPATQPSTSATRPVLSEQRKVELLIDSIRNLKDAIFIRNGQEHSGEVAAALLQYRWNRDKEQIKTAEEFIRKAATQSSTTGQPYSIRFKDGTEIKSEQYLTRKLEELIQSRQVPSK